ncbi:MAG: hypothetical protein ABS81_06920 [Pseudonocardia sp. SCN 72-86]|nr:MAG: hypothetical protein ABS81_06920 [Pseudonocardia sp. SCN 72-86]
MKLGKRIATGYARDEVTVTPAVDEHDNGAGVPAGDVVAADRFLEPWTAPDMTPALTGRAAS